jgi:hypothetical protein
MDVGDEIRIPPGMYQTLPQGGRVLIDHVHPMHRGLLPVTGRLLHDWLGTPLDHVALMVLPNMQPLTTGRSGGHHPDWCSRHACTAYVEQADELHRSEPVVIETDDPTINVFVYRTADPGGDAEYIEMVKLTVPSARPWYLAEPLPGTELVLPVASAGAISRAVAVLTGGAA